MANNKDNLFSSSNPPIPYTAPPQMSVDDLKLRLTQSMRLLSTIFQIQDLHECQRPPAVLDIGSLTTSYAWVIISKAAIITRVKPNRLPLPRQAISTQLDVSQALGLLTWQQERRFADPVVTGA